MLDSRARPLIDKPLAMIAKRLVKFGIRANQVTIVGFLFGLVAILDIALGNLHQALFFILLNRLFDGLDGAIARQTELTDFGGFLDIICDFLIYSGVIFAFALYDIDNALPAAFLILCYIGPMSSFLAYAALAAKRKITTTKRGKKSFYYLGGLCEGTETTLVMILMCAMPALFEEICLTYGILCILTTFGRVYNAYHTFK